MTKIKLRILILLITLFMIGCQGSKPSPENTVPVTETVQQTEVPSVPDIPETEETEPGVDQYLAFQWMVNLKAEEIAYVEFLNLSEPQFPYRRYEGDEIQEVIDLFQAKQSLEYMPIHPIHEYAPIVQWPGYYSKEFHVVMKDGTAHTVCSVYSTVTVIDGTGFHTISDWLNNQWPDSGNAPLPEHWAQEAAARAYHTAEDSSSTLSTQSHEQQRFQLDQSYDTNVEFGSLSRHYPIGRGGVELSASKATRNSCTLNARWTGTSGITSLHVQPQYWLEKWQEDTESYASFDDGAIFSESPQQLLPDASLSWYISWKDARGALEPGHYRVGMIFFEEYNGSIQNETTCYAKFSIS